MNFTNSQIFNRKYIQTNGIDVYDRKFLPRRTREALGQPKPPKVVPDVEESNGLAYVDLVELIRRDMQAKKDARKVKESQECL